MDEVIEAALTTIIEALYDSGAVSEKAVRGIVTALQNTRGTWGGEAGRDDRISTGLESLAQGIDAAISR